MSSSGRTWADDDEVYTNDDNIFDKKLRVYISQSLRGHPRHSVPKYKHVT